MKKVLLFLLAVLMLAPATVSAKDELTPDQYKQFWEHTDAKVVDDANQAYEALTKVFKGKAEKVETQPMPDGSQIKYYPLTKGLGGVYANADAKVLAYEVKYVEASSVQGLADYLKFDLPTNFKDMLEHPDKYPTQTLLSKNDKTGLGLSVLTERDKKGNANYSFSVMIFRDLDLFDTLYQAMEDQKN